MSKHYNWTPKEIQAVRERIREKANYKCYFCNKDIRTFGLAYTTHHIIPKRILKEKCWEEKYLICICKDCHIKIERLSKIIFLNKEEEEEKGND